MLSDNPQADWIQPITLGGAKPPISETGVQRAESGDGVLGEGATSPLHTI